MQLTHRLSMVLPILSLGLIGCTDSPLTHSSETQARPEYALNAQVSSENLKSLIVKYRADAPEDRLIRTMALGAKRAFDPVGEHHIAFDIPSSLVKEVVAQLSSLPWVQEVIVRNDPGIRMASLSSNTARRTPFLRKWTDLIPWGVHYTNADLVQSVLSNTGSGVKVGIMDTGVDCSNGDLNIVGGVDETGDAGLTYCDDPYNHGTNVAGIIGALANGSGVVGMAPSASLYSIRVHPNGSLATYTMFDMGLSWAISHGIQVINISLVNCGGRTYFDSTFDANMQSAVSSSHIVIVAAAGNGTVGAGACPSADSVSTYATPAGVIAVAAFNHDTTVPTGFQHGSAIYIAGPESVATVAASNFDGTSAAAPHVSGAAALMLAQGMSYAIVPLFLSYETQHKPAGTGYPRNTTYGYGFLDAAASVLPTPQVASFVTNCTGVVYTGDVCHVSMHRNSTMGYSPFTYTWRDTVSGGWSITSDTTSDSTYTFTVPGDGSSSFNISVGGRISDDVSATHHRDGAYQEIEWFVCPGGENLRSPLSAAAAAHVVPSLPNLAQTTATHVFRDKALGPKRTPRPLFSNGPGSGTDAICP